MENREEIMQGKPYGVRVAGYKCWFLFDYYENVEWFMKLCAEDGNASCAFKRNELGQYELFSWLEVEDIS